MANFFTEMERETIRRLGSVGLDFHTFVVPPRDADDDEEDEYDDD